MARITVAKCAEFLVITSDKCRTRVDPTADVDESAIQAQAEFRHRIGFINICTRKQLRSNRSENLLSMRQNVPVIFAAAGDIKQTDQDALRTSPYGIIEVSGNSLPGEDSRYIGATNLSKDSRYRFYGRTGDRTRRMEAGEHSRSSSGKLAQERQRSKQVHQYGNFRFFELFAVFVAKIFGQVRLQLAVVGMDRGTESSFGGISLADALQNALDITHSVGVCDEGDSGQ